MAQDNHNYPDELDLESILDQLVSSSSEDVQQGMSRSKISDQTDKQQHNQLYNQPNNQLNNQASNQADFAPQSPMRAYATAPGISIEQGFGGQFGQQFQNSDPMHVVGSSFLHSQSQSPQHPNPLSQGFGGHQSNRQGFGNQGFAQSSSNYPQNNQGFQSSFGSSSFGSQSNFGSQTHSNSQENFASSTSSFGLRQGDAFENIPEANRLFGLNPNGFGGGSQGNAQYSQRVSSSFHAHSVSGSYSSSTTYAHRPATVDTLNSIDLTEFQLEVEQERTVSQQASTQQESSSGPKPLSVAEVLQAVNFNFSQNFNGIYLKAEISTLSVRGAHCYLTLQDADGQASIRATVWQWNYNLQNFAKASDALPEDFKEGVVVECYGELRVYERTGNMQLMIKKMRLFDQEGKQKREFERLYCLILENGWNLPDRKKTIPSFPKIIGIVTSPKAAGLQDILKTLRERGPDIQVIVYEAKVQGKDAPESIVAGIEQANLENRVELLIVGRGGGAAEDLAVFNDERVLRAIVASKLPVISAVGHQTDSMLSDLVADVSCVTPTASAQYITESRVALLKTLESFAERLTQLANQFFFFKEHQIQNFDQQLSLLDPQRKVADLFSKTAELEQRMHLQFGNYLAKQNQELTTFSEYFAKQALGFLQHQADKIQFFSLKFAGFNPVNRLQHIAEMTEGYANRLHHLKAQFFQERDNLLANYQHKFAQVANEYLNYHWRNFGQWESQFNFQISRLKSSWQAQVQQQQSNLAYLEQNLQRNGENYLRIKAQQLESLQLNLNNAKRQVLRSQALNLQHLVNRLEVVNPYLPLERGYALVLNAQQQPITSIKEIKASDNLMLQLHDGMVDVSVNATEVNSANSMNVQQKQMLDSLKELLAELSR